MTAAPARGYPATWPKDAVPAVWKTSTGAKPGAPDAPHGYAPYKARMCSWCGAEEFEDGTIRTSARSTKDCPRCPILTEVGRAARPRRNDVRDDGDSDNDEEPPRRAPRGNGTMKLVTEKKKPAKEPSKTYSGVFNFRAGADLHERLAREAESETLELGVSVSLNDMTKKLLEEALTARSARRATR